MLLEGARMSRRNRGKRVRCSRRRRCCTRHSARCAKLNFHKAAGARARATQCAPARSIITTSIQHSCRAKMRRPRKTRRFSRCRAPICRDGVGLPRALRFWGECWLSRPEVSDVARSHRYTLRRGAKGFSL